MPVSGLVVTFKQDVSEFPESVQRLEKDNSIEVGQANGPKLAIVVDTNSRDRDREIWHWVHTLPGVVNVEVAFVGFE